MDANVREWRLGFWEEFTAEAQMSQRNAEEEF